MPSESREPLFYSWPECGHEMVALFDVTLTCTLPKHHEYDGQFEHQNDDGTRWWLHRRKDIYA